MEATLLMADTFWGGMVEFLIGFFLLPLIEMLSGMGIALLAGVVGGPAQLWGIIGSYGVKVLLMVICYFINKVVAVGYLSRIILHLLFSSFFASLGRIVGI